MTLSEWLVTQLKDRDMTQAELARKSKLTRQAIQQLAEGLMVSPGEIFAAIGGKSKSDAPDPRRERLDWILSLLPAEDVDEIIDYANLRMEKMIRREHQQQHNNSSAIPKHRPANGPVE